MKLTPGINLLKVMLYAALAAGISIGTASAQNVIHGKFTLPFEARWGSELSCPATTRSSSTPPSGRTSWRFGKGSKAW